MSAYPPVPPNAGIGFTKTSHADTYPAISPAKSNCAGKSVFITGASKGIGLATALAYATAGASHIGLGARTLSDSIADDVIAAAKKAGHTAPQVLKVHLDVQDPASVKSAAAETEKAFGRLDILMNNAGYLSPFVPMLEADDNDYWMNYEINLRGVYLVSKAFLPLLLKGGDMTIINLSSAGGLTLTKGGSAYQTTKHALLRFTEFLNVDYGELGLLAYSVHPGGIMTELAKNMPEWAHNTILKDKVEVASDTIVFLTQMKREWLAGRYISCQWDMPEFISREKEIVEGDKLKMRMVF